VAKALSQDTFGDDAMSNRRVEGGEVEQDEGKEAKQGANLIKTVPIKPPNVPITTNGRISNHFH
jgi:hypothetical protein